MAMSDKNFFLLSGNLRVAAKGYWFTGGGAKGSFGFYPHLKDEHGIPVYPDTQIHGDLRMAAGWAEKLRGTPDTGLIDLVFGKSGNETASLLHVGDLTIEDFSTWNVKRFQIKPRIEIADDSRSVEAKMLMFFEAAWLEGLRLTAPVYVGYFIDETKANEAKTLLENACRLLSGFGALRSRGYGRGSVTLSGLKIDKIKLDETIKALEGEHNVFLTALVNVRSKPVAVERMQLVGTNTTISAEQVRAWLVKTYWQVTGDWPTDKAMADISFSTLYPSGKEKRVVLPAPMTTLRKEGVAGTIDDYWDRPPETKRVGSMVQTVEGATDNDKTKLKPLKPGSVVTANKIIVQNTLSVRMRNAIKDTFLTKDEGLFAQQYLPAGTVFCGSVKIGDKASPFIKKAAMILSSINPVINGVLFKTKLAQKAAAETAVLDARVVVDPIDYDLSKYKNIDDKESFQIGSLRRYNAPVGRPRRNRPAILPGSVLTRDVPQAVRWSGFKQSNLSVLKSTANNNGATSQNAAPLVQLPAGVKWDKITRAQAGHLREILNPDNVNPDVLTNYLDSLIEKHSKKKSGAGYEQLYNHLKDALDNRGVQGLRILTVAILDQLKLTWWETKNKEAEATNNEHA